jgi:hypothetical protein
MFTKNLIISIMMIFFLVIFFSHSSATTYYVKPGGDDNLLGTSEATAWQHIMKACATLVPGDTVLIMGGVYDEISPEQCNNGQPCGTLRPARSGEAGRPITYKGHPNYQRPVIKGGNYTRYAVNLGDRSYITLDSLEVTESFRGITMWNASYITVQNCIVHHTIGPCNDNNGGVMLGYEPCDHITVRNCSLYHNYENCGGSIADGWNNSGIHVYRTKNSLFENNVIWDQPAGFGIRLKWLDTTNVVRRNTIHDVNSGISVGEDGLNNQIYENVIYNTNENGFVIISTTGYSGANNTQVWNNTIYNSRGSGIKLYPNSTITNFQSWNNIVANCHGDYGVGENWALEGNNHPGLNPDYNCYFDDFENIVVYWHGTSYTLAQYRSATGLDQHSIQANPMFVNPPTDFHLQSGSPCKGTGQGGVDMGAYPSSASDTTPPANITNLAASSPTSSSITLSWTAPGDDGNNGTASQYDIRYSTSTITQANWPSATQVNGEPTPQVAGTSQNMTVSGLNSSTTYYFAMETADEVPNWSGLSNVASGTTSAAGIDTTPPVISNVQSSGITHNSAVINWTTNEPATSRVNYGLTTSYGFSTTLDTSLVINHSQNLTGLSSSTLYHYRVRSRDQAGNEQISSDYTFTTLASPDTTPPVISNVQASQITHYSAVIGWTTNESATSRVEYGLTASYGSSTALDTNLVTNHSQDLTGLVSDTLYHYRVRSIDQAGNERISSDYTFTTADSSRNLAAGVTAGVDGTYPGYTVTPITERVINPYGGTATTWASDEDSTLPHWIVIDFGGNRTVNNVVVFWAWNNYQSRWMTPREFHIQYWTGSNYVDTAVVTNPPIGSATVATFPEVTTSRIRVLQPSNMGPIYYPSIIWLTELEMYGPSDTTPPVISNVQASGITHNSAIIGWITNEPATSRVNYGLTTSYGSSTTLDTSLVISHSQNLTGLSSSTLYHYRVRSMDQAGNERISSDSTFTTLAPPDTTPPVISNVHVTGITRHEATINWNTNEAATSRVEYGLTTSYGLSTSLDTNLVTNHSQRLTKLRTYTLYHYRVRSTDGVGNEAISPDYTFRTARKPGRPGPISPCNDTTLGVPNPDLVILNGTDSLGFPLLHFFQLDTTTNFNSPKLQQSSDFALEYPSDSTTLWTIPQALTFGTYYWRAYSYTNTIPSDTSDPSDVCVFNEIFTGVTDTLYRIDWEYPLQNDTVPTTRPLLVARLVSGSMGMNPLSCQFEVSEDPGFQNNNFSSERITFSHDGSARWEVTQDLKQNARFYCRAKLWSQDRLLDITQKTVIFTGAIHVFPNPFKPSLGHSYVTFRNIPLNSTIRITTISGDLVKTFDSTDQTDIVWDVKSEDQKELASGVYLYWVSHEGTVISGKIFVIR